MSAPSVHMICGRTSSVSGVDSKLEITMVGRCERTHGWSATVQVLAFGDLDLSLFELKIGTLVSIALMIAQANLFFSTPFCFQITRPYWMDRRTDEQDPSCYLLGLPHKT